MNLFNILPPEFFKPLTSKYRETYMDCIFLIYNTYKTELSFGVDKEVIVSALEYYFDEASTTELIFEDDEEVAKDSRSKANGILRRLKDNGWLEYEIGSDHRIKVNLYDYAATMIESFNKIIKNEEMEYQSLVSQIHATLLNRDAYIKPYEYIIKRVIENTEELMIGLKKLNSNIKKYIDAITNQKSANEIVQDFFVYHKDIGSKAYHRIKTSDNISYFRTSIIESLYQLLTEQEVFQRAIKGYMEIEQVEDIFQAEEDLKWRIYQIIGAFRNYDAIIEEIDSKNSRYISSAVARAKFLLTNTNNVEGKITKILAYLSQEFNNEEVLNLNDETDDALLEIFNIFPQGFLDSESLYVIPITKKVAVPELLEEGLGMSEEERSLRKMILQEKNRNRFSRKNINDFVYAFLQEEQAVLATSLPLVDKRDLIRILFISLYSKDPKSIYHARHTEEFVEINGFRFKNFWIERRLNVDGNI